MSLFQISDYHHHIVLKKEKVWCYNAVMYPEDVDGMAESEDSYETPPGPEVIKHFSCSSQLSMKFFLLINVKMPTTVGILTFMNRKNTILGLSEPEEKVECLDIYILMSI